MYVFTTALSSSTTVSTNTFAKWSLAMGILLTFLCLKRLDKAT